MRLLRRPLVLLLFATTAAFAQAGDVFYQTSTIDALLQGVYDGATTFEELARHGDFGIGTFNGADGEMIALGGRFFQIASDGKARPVAPTLRTPFASVTRFHATITLDVAAPTTYDELMRKIDAALPSPNYFYAVRVTGRFDSLKARSVPRQHPPYPPLAEVVKTQPVFEFKDARGTLVGFRCPEFAKGVNVPGYHLHFLNRDETGGGHLLSCVLREGKVEIDVLREFQMALPSTPEFAAADLVRDRAVELRKVEK
jgi:acetolactate decarboxylase